MWIQNKNQIVDYIADFLQNWLEDNIKEELFVEMESTINSIPNKEQFYKNCVSLLQSYLDVRKDSFEEQLNKLTPVENV
jgi:hypothetical protein